MYLGISLVAFLVFVLVLVLVLVLVARRGRALPLSGGAATVGATVSGPPPVVTVPAPVPPISSVTLPILSFEDEDLEEPNFGIEYTQLGASASLEAGPAAKILYDDDAVPEEPTQARTLILVSATGQSDCGKRRKENEDNLLVHEADGLFVVADGMGGYRGGAVASTLAVKTIHDVFASKNFLGAPHTAMPRRASELARAIQMANRAILEKASADRQLEGMGTTVSAARFSVDKQRLYIGHVGDSRIYRVRDGALRQMTSDHTMKELGVEGSTGGHLSRAVGIWPVVPVDIILGKPRAGDVYLLCSDGLPKMVSDAEIEHVLKDDASPAEAVNALIGAANYGGGKDNVTVVVIHIHSPTEDGKGGDPVPAPNDRTAATCTHQRVGLARGGGDEREPPNDKARRDCC